MIIVEDGSIVAGANSYVSVADLTAYVNNRGITFNGDPEQLLHKAMDVISNSMFVGIKKTAGQPLQWPRYEVFIDGYPFPSDAIPTELKNAQMAMALEIADGADPINQTPQVKRQRVEGAVEVEYAVKDSAQKKRATSSYYLSKLVIPMGSGVSSIPLGRR